MKAVEAILGKVPSSRVQVRKMADSTVKVL